MTVADSILRGLASGQRVTELPDHELAYMARRAGSEALYQLLRGTFVEAFQLPQLPTIEARLPVIAPDASAPSPALDSSFEPVPAPAAEPAREERPGTRPTRRLVSEETINALLKHLRENGETSLKQLEKLMGRSQSNVLKAAVELQHRGLIKMRKLARAQGKPVFCDAIR